MKRILQLLLLFTLLSCTDLSRMNDKIYEVQKQHLLQSPYKDANTTLLKIEAQKQFRSSQIPKFLKDKIFNRQKLSDTLLILEDFDEMCSNCPSYRMQVLYQDTVYSIERELIGDRAIYKGKLESFDSTLTDEYGRRLKYFEFMEIKNKIKRNQNWTANPLDYGSDSCLDGNHTLFTAIYPDEKVKALYVRCWWPESERELFKKN